ncbi:MULTISPECIES: phosphotransferase family protein [unclassified Luteococcus]|uniref:phosphotransferase family protein n=1 Tax=unclassified Luteococcus TaxID=2639923 RepID=UPI00313B5F01
MNQTSPDLTVADLRRLVHSAYGSSLSPVDDNFARELPTSGPARTFLVELADGRPVVLRVAPPPDAVLLTQERDRLAAEVEALQVIAEHTGVPVPTMHHHDDSYQLVAAEWFCREYLPGRILPAGSDLTDPALAGLRAELDQAARALHTITGEGFGHFLQPTLGSWQDAFTGLVEDLLADGQRLGVDLGIPVNRVHAAVLAAAPALDGVTEPVFCPWALGIDGVVVDSQNRLVGLVQPDRVLWGDPLMEVDGLGAATTEGAQEPLRRRLYQLYSALTAAMTPARGATPAAPEGASRVRELVLGLPG